MTKHLLSIGFVAMLAATLGFAQSADHIVVPLSHPSQPATLKVSLINGSITVHAYAGKDVIVDSTSDGESRRGRRERNPPAEAQGMHRLTMNPGLTAEEDNNVVSVHSSVFNGGGSDLVIQVPEKSSLNLHTINGGNIEVDGVQGDINVEDINGSITLSQVAGSIVAHGLNGKVTATVTQLDPSKPSSFSSLNGTIDVTLPAAVRANVRMKTDQGDIYMDDGFNFQATHGGGAGNAQGQREADGMYKVKIDRTIYGTLNGGGPEIRFENFNGNIYLRKGK